MRRHEAQCCFLTAFVVRFLWWLAVAVDGTVAPGAAAQQALLRQGDPEHVPVWSRLCQHQGLI